MPEQTPESRAQEKRDYIDALKLQIDEAEEEDKRLDTELEERKQELKDLEGKIREKEGYIIKLDMKKKKGMKK